MPAPVFDRPVPRLRVPSCVPDLRPMSAPPPILALKGVTLHDGPALLLDSVDLALEPRARACLVGANGAGKSTLLRMLTGEIEPDEGERSAAPSAKVVLVAQEPAVTGASLLDYATSGGAP